MKDTNLSLDEIEVVLSYFSSSILGMETKEEIAWDLAKNCISKLHFEDCVIYFVDFDRNVLTQVAAFGPKNPFGHEIHEPIEIPLGIGVSGFCAVTGESKIVPNTLDEPLYIQDDQHRLSEISVPIFVNDRVVGVIDCEHSEENFFTTEHLKVLEAIASMCSIKFSRLLVES